MTYDFKINGDRLISINNLSNILNMLLIEKKIKPTELARQTNIPQPTIQRIVRGTTTKPHLASLKPIAEFFSIKLEQLLGLEPISWLNNAQISSKQLKSIPIFGWDEVSKSGELNNGDTEPKNEHIISDVKVGKNAYALVVKDASMEPIFSKGTKIIIDPQKELIDRCFIIVKLANNKEAMLRQLIMEGTTYFIKPLSSELRDFKMHEIETCDKICGVVVQAKRDFDAL